MNQSPVVPNEGEHVRQPASLEHRPGLARAHQLQDLDALLGQVLGHPGASDVGHDEPVAHGLDGAVDGHDAAGALGAHVQVEGDGAGGGLEDLETILVDKKNESHGHKK